MKAPSLVVLLGFVAFSGSVPTHSRNVEPNGKRADVSIPDPASLVNLFIVTTGPAHAFPGASTLPVSSLVCANDETGVTLPHGMVKVGMDTDSPDNVCSLSHYDVIRS